MAFITVSDPKWKCLLQESTYDVYHLPNFASLEANYLNGKALAWFYEEDGNKILIPLISRNIGNDNTLCDLLSPYGYSGILYPKNTAHATIIKALKLFYKEASDAGYISSFIRLHPLYNTFHVYGLPYLVQHNHGSTISINLTQPLAAIQNSFCLNHKRNLQRLKFESFYIEFNKWKNLTGFVNLYTETMQRKKAHKRYFFAPEYFQQLKTLMPTSLFLIAVFNVQGEMVAAGLFTLFNGLAQFYLGATANKYVNLSPSKLMIDAAIIEMQKLGAKILHLGGGHEAKQDDGLFRFKSGFSKQYLNYSTLRIIHNQAEYSKICQDKGICQEDIDNMNGFFPAYRMR